MNKIINNDELAHQNDDYKEYNQVNHQKLKLSISQKIAIAFLVFFAVLIFFYNISSMNNRLSLKKDYSATENKNLQTDYQQEDSQESLKNKDTDQDGLSDWDELNIYKTSPYLEDSDSDGYLDGAEIESKTNPICPLGRDCDDFSEDSIDSDAVNGVLDDSLNSDVLPSNVLDNNILNSNEINKKTVDFGNEDLNNIMSGNIEASKLRETLIEFGMDKTVLDKFSDKELMETYQNTIKEQK